MKIAFIVDRFPALSQTFIINQITGLIDHGYEVDIYADRSYNNLKMHADVAKYNLLNHTYYFRNMPQNKFWRRANILGLILKYYYKRPKILLKTLRLSKSLNLSKYGKYSIFKVLCTVIPFLDKGPYDIIHCHFGPCGILGVILKDLGVTKGKVITAFHGHDISAYLKEHGNNIYNSLFLKGDLFLPISERWKNTLIELGCNERKIIVHRMGIDTSKFLFSPGKHTNNGKVRLLTIGRLVEKKGVQYGIQAVAKVLREYPNIEYKIAGDGPLKNSLEDLVKELNIGDHVKFLGWKQQEEIVELLKDTDLLIAPSVTGKNADQEGIPVVLMEAMAQGLPVISTQHSGIPELVKDGESGFLVPERDANSLAEKLEFLVKHPEIWEKMGLSGRKYVEKYYDSDTLNDKLVELYRLVLDESHLE